MKSDNMQYKQCLILLSRIFVSSGNIQPTVNIIDASK